jgi:phosphatidylserine decarboxylase
MLTYRYPIIAREGWPLIGLLTIVALGITAFLNVDYALPFWLFVLLLVYIYRDPARKIPSSPLAVVAPVDGRILSVTTVKDPFVEREALRLIIAMNLLGIYSARSPIEGKLINQWHCVTAGSEINERLPVGSFAQWIQTDEGDDVVMTVKQRARVQTPRCYAQSGDRVGQGQRCGFVPLGAEVEVLVPVSSRVEVKAGDSVRAGSDIIATLMHHARND